MTPFGEKLRAIRAERKLALKDMAAGLQVSPAYLSAMEHGRRGKPSRRFVHRVCQFLGIIWDEAEELQRLADLSHPRITVDTAGLSPKATLLANTLAQRVGELDGDTLDRLLILVSGKEAAAEGADPATDDPARASGGTPGKSGVES